MGRVEDKIKKNRLVALKTPGPEILQKPETFSGQDGTTLIRLDPWGVIASVIPCTNSTETIINNGIGMISAGNAVVFNSHPIAKNVSADCVRTINRAIAVAGGPRELLCCISEPSIESANALMAHPLTPLVLVTGGGAVVQAAMKSGKRAICAGPGNPPAVVDETACPVRAAQAIVSGASLDNNVVCTDEKEVIAVEAIADKLKAEMLKLPVVEMTGSDIHRLTELVLSEKGGPRKHGAPNKKCVGKNPSVILKELGKNVDDSVRLILVDVDKDHPLIWTEQLMPVLPLCRVPNANAAIAHAVAVEECRRHTASIHSERLDRITKFSNAMNCSICVVNESNYAGLGMNGEGYTSFSISTPTGEGLTTAKNFCRERRLAMCGGSLRRS
jgi:propionaldehyde dehydrogenase